MARSGEVMVFAEIGEIGLFFLCKRDGQKVMVFGELEQGVADDVSYEVGQFEEGSETV